MCMLFVTVVYIYFTAVYSLLRLFTSLLRLFTGLLQLTTDGTLLKPVQSPPRGEREANFYTQVFDRQCTDPVLLDLRPLLPLYLGSWSSPDQPTGQCYFLSIALPCGLFSRST